MRREVAFHAVRFESTTRLRQRISLLVREALDDDLDGLILDVRGLFGRPRKSAFLNVFMARPVAWVHFW